MTHSEKYLSRGEKYNNFQILLIVTNQDIFALLLKGLKPSAAHMIDTKLSRE